MAFAACAACGAAGTGQLPLQCTAARAAGTKPERKMPGRGGAINGPGRQTEEKLA